MKLLVDLDEISEQNGARVGGKAVALAALHRAGQAVPRTFCLTTEAYEVFVVNASLRAVIHQELGRKSFEDMRWEEIWDVALRIRNRFLRAPIPDEIRAMVDQLVSRELSERPLAVRSSAPGEDSETTSFAGLHDSFVGVRGTEGVLDAIRGVWASLWTDRALLYRQELGIDVDTSAMAVIIQELVEEPTSGIGFSVHPSDPALAVVEAVYGLNQGLVDGTIEPDRWELDRATGRTVRHTAPGERRRLVAHGTTTVTEPVPGDRLTRPPLDDAGLASVFQALQTTEALFGGPQDVEWTLGESRLVLLQSRPITTSSTDDGDRRAWYLSLTRSLDNLRSLHARVENELLPNMDREAHELADQDLAALDDEGLASEIERRRAAHDRWVDIYWREFIPLAHGIRLFGQYYNDVMRPADPHEFMGLLAATPMLSIRRNQELSQMASEVRRDRPLRERLERGDMGSSDFEARLESFEREFGGATYADQQCFADRGRLVRFVLSLAAASTVGKPTATLQADELAEAFLAEVPEDRHDTAREILDLGRASYRLRDDDNIHLARLEGLILEAVAEGRRRIELAGGEGMDEHGLETVVAALRHPNLVVEPQVEAPPMVLESGFRARPRQLVGQPAGPGLAEGPARIVAGAADLFEFQPGEVLVCDAVDPNMTFIVPIASAVVERRGGMLIHGAIIAREYGLPCVTGVPDVTKTVSNGDRLTVDGYLGIVTVTDPVARSDG